MKEKKKEYKQSRRRQRPGTTWTFQPEDVNEIVVETYLREHPEMNRTDVLNDAIRKAFQPKVEELERERLEEKLARGRSSFAHTHTERTGQDHNPSTAGEAMTELVKKAEEILTKPTIVKSEPPVPPPKGQLPGDSKTR